GFRRPAFTGKTGTAGRLHAFPYRRGHLLYGVLLLQKRSATSAFPRSWDAGYRLDAPGQRPGKPDRGGVGGTQYHAGEQPAGKGFGSEEGRFVRSGNEKPGGLGFLDEMRACRLLVSVF